ncbi:MAG TPA: hypothetical protein VFO82_13480 [Steroidobacteraceae bacterium]|nr:hypothetical protein [Steroidobacteraceae bacterium]
MKNKLLVMIAMAAALAGCSATKYQPMAFTGGYKDVHIRDNVYYVSFAGNSWIDTGTVVQYFHRRAKELCTEKGFGNYRVLTEKDNSQLYAMASYGSAQTMEKPAYGGQVECVN